MDVKAKFRCTAVTKFDSKQEKVEFMPVSSGSEENKQWSQYTPSGGLWMNITAEGAQGAFEPGKEYYLTITPA